MVTYRGYKTVVVYADETAYGTGGTADQVIEGKLANITLNKSNTLIRTLGLGEGRNETFVGLGNFEGSWSAEYEVAGFDFLRYAIGSHHGSGTTAAPYFLQEEDFMNYGAGSTNGMKSFQMIVNSLDVTGGTHNRELLTGCAMNTLGLSLELGATLKASVEGFFKTVTSGTTITAFTANTTKPWIFAQGNFNWNDNNVARVTNATININNNFDAEVGRELGSRFVQAAEPGLRKYDWTITVKMTDTIATSLRDHFYGQANSPHTGVTTSEPTLYGLRLDLAEGTSSSHRNARITLANCSINDISKPINIGDNIVELTINGAAKHGETTTTNRPIRWWTAT